MENVNIDGYNIIGWLDEDGKDFDLNTPFDKDFVLTAKVTPIEYKITYELDGGTNSELNPAKYTIETNDLVLNQASKEGYKFIGWFSDQKYQNKVEKIEKGTFGDIILYVLFEIETYKVNYIVDEKTISTEDVVYDNYVLGINAPTKDYYEFKGWYTDSEYKNEFNLKNDVIKCETNLYAKFDAIEYTITYVLDGGTNSNLNPATYTIVDFVEFKNPTKEGYIFDGWYFDLNDSVDAKVEFTFNDHEDLVLYARWIKIITITFNDGNSVIKTINVHNGDILEFPEEPQKDHYTFDGWYIGEEKISLDALTKIDNSVELVAKWIVDTYEVSYFIVGNQKPIEIERVDYNSLANGPKANLERDGYYFDGWYTNEACTDSFDLTKEKIEADISLYGQYVELTNNVEILQIVGANEAVYLKASFVNGYEINDYKVSYLLNNNFVQIDSNLVRFVDENNDGKNDYVRADIVGLTSGQHTIKVELGDSSTTKNVMVSAQDRSGYAHFNYENGIGAYNNDGTLKDNAVVVYVNEANKNTVTATVNGSVRTGISAILQAATDGTPVDVRIIGTIGAATWKPLTVSGYSSATTTTVLGANNQYLALQSYDEYQIIAGGFNELDETNHTKLNGLTNKIKYDSSKCEFDSYYNMLDISNAKNVTVEGIGDDAKIFQWGFTWKNSTSIEVKNLTFDDYTEDACSFEGSDDSLTIDGFKTGHLWVHHNTFEKGVNYWDVCSEQDKHDGDGTTDFKKLAYVTVSYNHYIENHKTGLVGGSDSHHTACLTFHHNFYDNCQSRLPFARQANMHMYNNYYYKSSGNNMQIYAGAYAFIENCYFENTKNTFKVIESTSGTGTPAVKSFNNIFDGCSNTGATIVTSRTDAVTNDNLYGQTFDTNSTIFYYDSVNQKSNVSIMQEAADVPAYVALHAGAGSGYFASLDLYNEVIEKHKVSFKYFINQQEVEYASISVVSGYTVAAPNFNLEGYELLGWYGDANFSTEFDFSSEITTDTTVYIKLRKYEQYKVDFVYNLGEADVEITSVILYEGNKVSKPSNPTLVGYKFIDWYTNADYEALFNFNTEINEDTTIYAKFEKVNVSVTNYTFDAADAQTYATNLVIDSFLTIHADSNKDVAIALANTSCGDVNVTKYLQLKGGGSTTYRCIEFTLTENGSVVVYYKASAGRHLVLNNGTTTISSDDTTGNLQAYTFENVSAGTYYLYSAGSGIDVYLISIVTDSGNQNPDPVDPTNYDELNLCLYYTARASQNTLANNGQYITNHVKTIYKVGESFDSTYLSALVDSQYVSSGFEFSGFDSTTSGKKTVTVTYGNYQGSFEVYVLPANFEVANNDNGYYVMVGNSYDVGGTYSSDNTQFTTFKTINQALEALEEVSPTASKRAYLNVAAGYYNEKVVISVPYLTITGAGFAKATYEKDESYSANDYVRATIIEWDSLYGTKALGGQMDEVTDSTQTVYITEKAINCKITDLTISNWWNNNDRFNSRIDYLASLGLASNNKVTEHRALALLVQADRVILNNVALLGYQDTVEFFTGRHYLENCYISGATDYIFGTNGTTYICNSIIHTIYNGSNTQGGFVNAFKGQNASENDSILYGCIYDGCTFEADSNVANGIVALGRPWTTSSSVMIMNSNISIAYSIAPTASSSVGRYCDWNSNILASDAKFYEYNNQGSGAIDSSITGCQVVNANVAGTYANFEVIFGRSNGNISYDQVWDGTTNPIVDNNIYYYFDGTAALAGSYSWTSSVEKSSATLGDLNIDATNGKFAYNSEGHHTQFNQGTVLTITVDSNCTIVINSYPGQYNYSVTCGDETTNANANAYSVNVTAGQTVTITATATAYLYSLVIQK